jgi:hypothetical protein
MKNRYGFVSNSSTSSFLLAPKPEYYDTVIKFIRAHMTKDDQWLDVWYHKIGRYQIAGGEGAIFVTHEEWLDHPEWFNEGMLEQDDYFVIFKLIDGHYLNHEQEFNFYITPVH